MTQTPFIISNGGWKELGKVHSLAWSGGEPVPVQRRNGEIYTLDLGIQYEIIHIPDDTVRGPYKVTTRGYMHTLQRVDEAEVIGFHWHPGGGPVKDPHMHIGTTQLSDEGVISKKHHLPGRRMSVEEVMLFCITQLEVEPLRPDWRSVLKDSNDIFRMFASWGGDTVTEVKDPND